MIVPLGTGAYKRADAFLPETRMLNLYLEKDDSGVSPDKIMRVQRPGMLQQYALGGTVRGMEYRTSNGEVLAVAGNALFSRQANKGVISGDDLASMVSTTFLTAIVGNSKLYLYDTTVSALALPDDLPVQDVDQLNQYVLVLTPSGRFYWIVPDETTIDPLDFATAESSADGGVAIRRVGDEFWIFGTKTIEVWQSTGDLDAPFQRVSGRYYERGCLSRDTVRRFDNTLMWVSDDGQVCRGGAVPQVVSDDALAERIRKRSGDLSAWVFKLDGHEFYVLNIGGQGTFAYDASTQAWCEFGTLGQVGWEVVTGYSGDVTLVGDKSGRISRLDPSAGDDNGTPIERVVTGTYGFLGRAGRNDSLSVGVGSSAPTVVRLRWKDGQEDYPDYYDEQDVRGGLDVVTITRLGTPLQPYRTVEVSCVTPERIRIAGCVANEGFAR